MCMWSLFSGVCILQNLSKEKGWVGNFTIRGFLLFSFFFPSYYYAISTLTCSGLLFHVAFRLRKASYAFLNK